MNLHETERYKTLSKSADPDMLYVSEPFTIPVGIQAISLGKVILDERGQFNGYVLAILDSEYFRVLLDSVLYAPDTRATLVHGGGKIVVRVPDPEHTTGIDLSALPNSQFNQYIQAGQTTNVFKGFSASTGDQRLTVIQAIRPLSNPADKPLLIAISREAKAIQAPWRKHLFEQAVLTSVIAVMAILGLLYYQRRQVSLARLKARHGEEGQNAALKIRDSSRSLELAIDSAKLGTWYWDIKANELVWSDACLALFGLPPGTAMNYDKFLALLHPQDRQRIDQTVARSLETKTDYNEDYHVIWPDGTERWINSIGRSFCSPDGEVERMEGIVQDITGRHAMQEEIRQHSAELEKKVEERTAELARAMKELDRLARQDVLTGLFNRLAANERLRSEFVSMKRSHSAYAVLMLDIDFFKQVNDTHGHAIGDQVLKNVAQTMRQTLRESDFSARFGGEEFLALLPATSLTAALQVAKKLRQAIEASPNPVAGTVTVSIGLALANPEQANEFEAVREADDALYRAKREGRNQVRVAKDDGAMALEESPTY